jgi:hypothetical protein
MCGNACAPGQTCASGKCTCGSASVSFSAGVQGTLATNCASIGCHAGVMPKEGLDLSVGKSYANLVNVAASECASRKRVVPGNPSSSYLLQKLLGVNLCSGSQMPKAGSSLPASDLQAISDWICEGAPNN